MHRTGKEGRGDLVLRPPCSPNPEHVDHLAHIRWVGGRDKTNNFGLPRDSTCTVGGGLDKQVQTLLTRVKSDLKMSPVGVGF